MEEIQKSLSPTVDTVVVFANRVWLEYLALASIQQAMAIVVTFGLAVIVHRAVGKFIRKVAPDMGNARWRRAIQTVSSISMSIVWVISLWLVLFIFGELGWKTSMIRLVASLINAWVVIRVASALIPSPFWSRIFAWFAWSIAALNAIGQLDPLIRWMDSFGLTAGELNITLWSVIQGVLVTGLLLWFALILARFAQARLETSEALNPSMKMLVSKIMRACFVVLAVVLGMQAVGIDLTAFAVFSGALGLGVGLGLQRTIGNLVAGFTMLADRSIKPGDVIEVETGDGPTYGEVKTLGARYVAVRTRSGTETLIPNELLISNAVTNWSFSDKRIRRGIPVGVSYNTDVEMAIRLCLEAAGDCKRILKVPGPVCLFSGFGDNSVDLELRFWLNDPEDGVANVRSELYLAVWKRFREHKIEIPFPQRDLHIRSGFPGLIDMKA